MPTVEPLLTKDVLDELYEGLKLADGRILYKELPSIVTDAQYVADHPEAKNDPKQKAYYKSKYFDRGALGVKENKKFKKIILAAVSVKNADEHRGLVPEFLPGDIAGRQRQPSARTERAFSRSSQRAEASGLLFSTH